MSRTTRPLALLGAAALVGAVGVAPATAQDDPGLGGYTLLARSSAVDYTYASPGLLATGDVIFQVSMPESLATLSSGPTGYALSSLAWPGPLLADIGTIVEQSSPEDQRPPFRIQSYPVRAEAFSPQGPFETTAEPAPGARMHAYSEGAVAAADGAFSHLEVPLIFEIGNVASDATSFLDGDVAVTQSHTVLSDVSILAGLVQISSIETVLEATSDGVEATATSSTTLGDVTFAGLAATIDEDGIHLVDQPSGGNDATGLFTDEVPFGDISGGLGQAVDPVSSAMAQLLDGVSGGLDQFAEQSGIDIRLVPGTQTVSGALGEASATGLYVELFYDGSDTPIITDLLNVLPFEALPGTYGFLPPQFPQPPFTPQALALMLKETHINSLSIGGGLVSANASEGFVLPPFDFDLGPGAGSDTGADSVLGDNVSQPLPTSTQSITTPDLPTASGGGLGLRPEPSLDELAARPVSTTSGQALSVLVVMGIIGVGAWSTGWARRLADHALAPPPG